MRLLETERQFQGMVINLAALNGWTVWHDHDSRRNSAGFPDLILLRGPRLIVAELKVDRRRKTGTTYPGLTTRAQRWMLSLFKEAGAEAVVWRPRATSREKWPVVETTSPFGTELGYFPAGEVERRLTRRTDEHDVQYAARYVHPNVIAEIVRVQKLRLALPNRKLTEDERTIRGRVVRDFILNASEAELKDALGPKLYSDLSHRGLNVVRNAAVEAWVPKEGR